MTSSRLFRIATLAALLIALTRGTPARADNVDALIKQLEGSGSDKVRLSAATNLSKLDDQRAILALAKAIGNDSNEDVRGIAAIGLGKLITDTTKASVKNLAVSALKRATQDDESDVVKSQADKALKAIGVTGTAAPPPKASAGTAIYVNIGPMSAKTGDATNDPKLKTLMSKIATKTMQKVASNMAITWPGGTPTQAQLTAKSTMGFYVDGTVNELKVKESGSSTTVSCKISMLLASFPDKSIFGLLNGGASVQASSSASDIALAREDCVSAVVEDLIAKKIVPTITTKATP
jgi:HEAT repeats